MNKQSQIEQMIKIITSILSEYELYAIDDIDKYHEGDMSQVSEACSDPEDVAYNIVNELYIFFEKHGIK